MNIRRDEFAVVAAQTAAQDRPARNGERDTMHKIEESIAYMREHLDRPLQVAALAALAKVSPSHFFALFKRRTGSAPIDYFTRLRMEKARRLLDATSLRVKEVATVLGYEDQFYFSRVFKSVNNLAPSEYRLSQRNGAAENGKKSTSADPRSTWRCSTDPRMETAGRNVKGETNWLPMENPQPDWSLREV